MSASLSQPRPARRVTVVGTLNIDQVWQVPALPRPGQTIVAERTVRQFGGKGANQAVAAARQGAHLRLVGAVGDDGEGRAYLEHLRRERIEVEHVTVIEGVASGAAHVYVEPRGENLIVVNRGANAHVPLASVSHGLADTDVVIVQLECELALALEALRVAGARGLRVVLNASPVNPRFPWGQHAIDTVIVNEHECAECFGRAPAQLSALASEARRAFLAERRINHLVVTQGANPTLHISAEETQQVPTYRVQPRDTVGAGDMFAGTLAAELAAGQEWRAALWQANVAAALSTLAVGAQVAMPTRADVARALELESSGAFT